MASDSDSARSFLEQLMNSGNRDLSIFLPLLLGFSASATATESQQDSDQQQEARGRMVLINPVTQRMIVIESNQSMEDMFRELDNKKGPKPATKASIEAMPTVVMREEDGDKECSICLDVYEVGVEAREMPCKHIYHSKCIEKWLGVHGSCPVCRHEMPVDESSKKASDEESEEEEAEEGAEGGRGRRIWVSFAFDGRRATTSADENDNN